MQFVVRDVMSLIRGLCKNQNFIEQIVVSQMKSLYVYKLCV